MKKQLFTKIIYQDKNAEHGDKAVTCTVIAYYILGMRIARKVFINPEWMPENEMQIRF